jgi:hypothetical protein
MSRSKKPTPTKKEEEDVTISGPIEPIPDVQLDPDEPVRAVITGGPFSIVHSEETTSSLPTAAEASYVAPSHAERMNIAIAHARADAKAEIERIEIELLNATELTEQEQLLSMLDAYAFSTTALEESYYRRRALRSLLKQPQEVTERASKIQASVELSTVSQFSKGEKTRFIVGPFSSESADRDSEVATTRPTKATRFNTYTNPIEQVETEIDDALVENSPNDDTAESEEEDEEVSKWPVQKNSITTDPDDYLTYLPILCQAEDLSNARYINPGLVAESSLCLMERAWKPLVFYSAVDEGNDATEDQVRMLNECLSWLIKYKWCKMYNCTHACLLIQGRLKQLQIDWWYLTIYHKRNWAREGDWMTFFIDKWDYKYIDWEETNTILQARAEFLIRRIPPYDDEILSLKRKLIGRV